jgi:FAD/FMN-containing dehydrogenase
MTLHSTADDGATFLQRISGSILTPDDSCYDEARSVWNGDINRRPRLIVRCIDTHDVTSAIGYARACGAPIAVRGGGHSISGASVVDDGVVIDLSELRSVTVDPVRRRARVGGGATLSDVDSATEPHGLAVPAGVISHTGVGGLTLGGGMGWLACQAGLTIDNLVSVKIVVADGTALNASATENPDLFWAVRGGGGNYGVVTEFEFVLHEIGVAVDTALFFWSEDQGHDALRVIRDTVPSLPDGLSAIFIARNLPEAPFIDREYHNKRGYVLIVVGFQQSEAHKQVVDQIHRHLAPDYAFARQLPWTSFQRMFDEAKPWGDCYYVKTVYLADLTDNVIDIVVKHLAKKSNALSDIFFYRLDRSYCSVDDSATAFGGKRMPQYVGFITGQAPTSRALQIERKWCHAFWEELYAQSLGGGYVNSMAPSDGQRLIATYGSEKLRRLASIKSKYDPDNIFRRNINIKPEG